MKFLSPEWAEAFKDAANASPSFQAAASSITIKLQQNVLDGPDGDVHYWLSLDGGTLDVGVGEIDDAQSSITQSYETAIALAKGELSPVAAYMSGQIQVTNLMKLMSLQGVLSELGPIIKNLPVEF
jgi:putative sterol carrier protein